MTTIIAVHSFRQGTGKSTIVANVAACLAMRGQTVGIADLNFPAPTAHLIFKVNMAERTHHFNDYLWGGCLIEEAIVELSLPDASHGRLFLLPASIQPHDMMRMAHSTAHVPLLNTGLVEFIESCQLDVLLLDLHGGLHDECLLAMAMTDLLWVVLRPDQQDFQGTGVLLELSERLGIQHVSLIVNEVPPPLELTAARTAVQEAYTADVLLVLPHEPELAALASTDVFCWQHPQHPMASLFAQLATSFLEQQ